MTSRIRAADVSYQLRDAGHTNSEDGTTWEPGYRCRQDSPRTVRIHHDGPNEAHHLDQYALTLRSHGYTITAEQPTGARRRLRVTHP